MSKPLGYQRKSHAVLVKMRRPNDADAHFLGLQDSYYLLMLHTAGGTAIIGFDISKRVSAIIQEHDLYVVEYLNDNFDFAICSPRTAFRNDIVHRRKPGAFHHLAFRDASRQEVDELYLKIKAIGAEIVHPPQIFHEHGSNYYATFFKDLDGIKYEIVFNQPI